jgi:outer membrane protein assembly factor BamB
VIDGERIYVTFGAPGTACLDRKTGQKLWERLDFVCNHFRGPGSSPLLYHDLLIMNFDGSDFQYVAALDKHTGKTVWKTDRSIDFKDIDPSGKPRADGDFRKGFSTPRVGVFDGKPLLISLGSKCLYAYDPNTGVEQWRMEDRDVHSGSDTPVIGDGVIYYGTGHGKPELWALRPRGSGVLDASCILWKVSRYVPTRSSVLLVDDLIYLTDDKGVASCVEAKTGKEVWHNRIGGEYSASPIYADGRVYFFNEQGKATVLAAGREFKVLGESQFGPGYMATPAVAGNALYLRTRTDLCRVEQMQR